MGGVQDLAVDENGRMFLLDAKLGRLRLVDRQGRLVAVTGRPGSGPGEFTARRPAPGGGGVPRGGSSERFRLRGRCKDGASHGECGSLPQPRDLTQGGIHRKGNRGFRGAPGGPVRGAIVDQDQLPGLAQPLHRRSDPPEELRHRFFFIVDGSDDGENWFHQRCLSMRDARVSIR